MDSLDRLRYRATAGDLVFLVVGLVVFFLLGLGHFWYPFVLGVLLGILNLHIHAYSVRKVADAATGGQSASVGIRAALLYMSRFLILVAVLSYEYLIRGTELLPAVFGLLGTYAVLVATGIMDARRHPGKRSAVEKHPESCVDEWGNGLEDR